MHKKEKQEEKDVSEEMIKRENTIISILINSPETFEIIEQHMKPEDYKYKINHDIAELLYEELSKEDSNISLVLDRIEDEKIQNHLTAIMAEDYGITDNKKAIEDILKKYEREKLEKRRDEIIKETTLEQDNEKKRKLGEELNNIILTLVKIK